MGVFQKIGELLTHWFSHQVDDFSVLHGFRTTSLLVGAEPYHFAHFGRSSSEFSSDFFVFFWVSVRH